jgi:uncharacterized membrane protein
MIDQKILKRNRERNILLLFLLEMSLFIFAGFMIYISTIFCFFIVITGIIYAVLVGILIEKNAVEKFKWGMK